MQTQHSLKEDNKIQTFSNLAYRISSIRSKIIRHAKKQEMMSEEEPEGKTSKYKQTQKGWRLFKKLISGV